MKNNEKGRSMVEMLGVLAIIGVLSAGGLAGYSKAMFKHKLNTTMDQITMLVTNIRTMFGTQENYENLSVPFAIKLGIVAQSARGGTNNSKMINPFKGEVTLNPVDVKGSVPNSGFTITYDGLPSEACVAIATADWGTGPGSGFVGVSAGLGTNATASTIGAANEGMPYKVTDAIDDCATSTTTSVTLYFY